MIAQSADTTRADDYPNTFFSCKFCNKSKGPKPVTDSKGRTILDPTRVAWSEHFEWKGERLRPRNNDAHAEYTYVAYKLDDPHKIARRRTRSKRLHLAWRLLETIPRIRSRLRKQAREALEANDLETLDALNKEMASLHEVQQEQIAILRRYSVLPSDAPEVCLCSHVKLEVPDWLLRQAKSFEQPTPR